MPRKQSPAQKATVERVMHEFKEGELETRGRKVKNPKQAVAIALSEAGASNRESETSNRHNLSRTKAKERRGETAEAEKEGRRAQARTLEKGASRSRRASGSPARRGTSAGETKGRSAAASHKGAGYRTRRQLYEEARKRDIPGRSKMNREQLARALGQ